MRDRERDVHSATKLCDRLHLAIRNSVYMSPGLLQQWISCAHLNTRKINAVSYIVYRFAVGFAFYIYRQHMLAYIACLVIPNTSEHVFNGTKKKNKWCCKTIVKVFSSVLHRAGVQ